MADPQHGLPEWLFQADLATVVHQLKPEWIHNTLAGLRSAIPGFDNSDRTIQIKLFIEHLLATDIALCCKGSLPDLATVSELPKGLYFVQLEDAQDVSRPLKDRYAAPNAANRYLKISLFDGKRSVLGVEHKSIPQLLATQARGTKIAIRGPVPLLRGSLKLDASHVMVLGGAVAELEQERKLAVDFLTKEPLGRRGPQQTLQGLLAELSRIVIEHRATNNNSSNITGDGGAPAPGTSNSGGVSNGNHGAVNGNRPAYPPSPLPGTVAPQQTHVLQQAVLQQQQQGQEQAVNNNPYIPPPPQQQQQQQQYQQQQFPQSEDGNGSISFGSGRCPPLQSSLPPISHHHYQQQPPYPAAAAASNGGGGMQSSQPTFDPYVVRDANANSGSASGGRNRQQPKSSSMQPTPVFPNGGSFGGQAQASLPNGTGDDGDNNEDGWYEEDAGLMIDQENVNDIYDDGDAAAMQEEDWGDDGDDGGDVNLGDAAAADQDDEETQRPDVLPSTSLLDSQPMEEDNDLQQQQQQQGVNDDHENDGEDAEQQQCVGVTRHNRTSTAFDSDDDDGDDEDGGWQKPIVTQPISRINNSNKTTGAAVGDGDAGDGDADDEQELDVDDDDDVDFDDDDTQPPPAFDNDDNEVIIDLSGADDDAAAQNNEDNTTQQQQQQQQANGNDNGNPPPTSTTMINVTAAATADLLRGNQHQEAPIQSPSLAESIEHSSQNDASLPDQPRLAISYKSSSGGNRSTSGKKKRRRPVDEDGDGNATSPPNARYGHINNNNSSHRQQQGQQKQPRRPPSGGGVAGGVSGGGGGGGGGQGQGQQQGPTTDTLQHGIAGGGGGGASGRSTRSTGLHNTADGVVGVVADHTPLRSPRVQKDLNKDFAQLDSITTTSGGGGLGGGAAVGVLGVGGIAGSIAGVGALAAHGTTRRPDIQDLLQAPKTLEEIRAESLQAAAAAAAGPSAPTTTTTAPTRPPLNNLTVSIPAANHIPPDLQQQQQQHQVSTINTNTNAPNFDIQATPSSSEEQGDCDGKFTSFAADQWDAGSSQGPQPFTYIYHLQSRMASTSSTTSTTSNMTSTYPIVACIQASVFTIEPASVNAKGTPRMFEFRQNESTGETTLVMQMRVEDGTGCCTMRLGDACFLSLINTCFTTATVTATADADAHPPPRIDTIEDMKKQCTSKNRPMKQTAYTAMKELARVLGSFYGVMEVHVPRHGDVPVIMQLLGNTLSHSQMDLLRARAR